MRWSRFDNATGAASGAVETEPPDARGQAPPAVIARRSVRAGGIAAEHPEFPRGTRRSPCIFDEHGADGRSLGCGGCLDSRARRGARESGRQPVVAHVSARDDGGGGAAAGLVGLIYAVAGVIGHFGRRVALAWSNGLAFEPRFQDAIGVVAVAMGIVVYVLARSGTLSQPRARQPGRGVPGGWAPSVCQSGNSGTACRPGSTRRFR